MPSLDFIVSAPKIDPALCVEAIDPRATLSAAASPILKPSHPAFPGKAP
jgi:hypothetical protein